MSVHSSCIELNVIVQGWMASCVAKYFPWFYCLSFLYMYIDVCNVFFVGVGVGAKVPKSSKSGNE